MEERRTPRRGHVWAGHLIRWGNRIALLVLVLLVGTELFARYGLGLGHPPLSVLDSSAGYRFAPNQDVMRFGNHVVYNSYSMRSEQFSPRKTSPNELRVMMIGDSVVNGGALTDQADLASSLLEKELSQKLGRKVIVGNISAGGWAPAHELGFVKKYGLFDADVVVLVESSHDAFGTATTNSLSVDFPTAAPTFALSEAIERYLPRYLPRFSFVSSANAAASVDYKQPQDTDDLIQLIRIAHSTGAAVIVAQHPDEEECNGSWKEGHDLILQAAERAQPQVVLQLRPHYKQAASEGQNVYRDGIHLSPHGQRILADALKPILFEQLAARVNHAGLIALSQLNAPAASVER